MSPRKHIYSSTPGDFNDANSILINGQRYVSMNNRQYKLVAAGFTYSPLGQRQYYDTLKNERGEYKDFPHDKLLKLIKPTQ